METHRDIELSLLVIDLGSECVVKVEKGHLPDNFCGLTNSVGESNSVMLDVSFTDLRAALEGEKPYPHIEDLGYADKRPCYRLRLVEDGTPDLPLGQVDLDALSQLCGKPLPIWSGGTWQKMNQQRITSDDTMSWSFDVWRYRR